MCELLSTTIAFSEVNVPGVAPTILFKLDKTLPVNVSLPIINLLTLKSL